MKKYLITMGAIIGFTIIILIASLPNSIREADNAERESRLYRNSDKDIDNEARRQLDEEWKAERKAEEERIQEIIREREEYERQAAIEKRKQELKDQGY